MIPTRVILHCAFTPDTPESRFSIDDIRRWHVEDFGWKDIGYHAYLTRDGIWHPGRAENIRGAHAGRDGNTDSLGLCYEGTWLPTQAQIKAICMQYFRIKKHYGINADAWYGRGFTSCSF